MEKQNKKTSVKVVNIVTGIVFAILCAIYTFIFIAFTSNQYSMLIYAIKIGIAMVQISIIPVSIMNFLGKFIKNKTDVVKRIIKIEIIIFFAAILEVLLLKYILMLIKVLMLLLNNL